MCNRDGLEADLGMVYSSYMSDDESIICTDCQDTQMDDGTPYSAYKIEGLEELYECGYFRHRDYL
jgi:hypothetical protein